jgi:hypothetical protein
MKLACTSSAFSVALDRGDLTQLEVLDLAARELAVDGVALDVRHFPRTDDDYLAQIKKMAVDIGLTIAAVESSDFFTAGAESARATLRVAEALGAPIVAAPLGSETELPWSAQLSQLTEASGEAKSRNITLALRNAPSTYAASTHDCKRATKETDSAWLRFGPEPARFDAASDPRTLADGAVLLWSAHDAAPEFIVDAWPAYRGFVALTDRDGRATAAEMKNAIRRWRIALSQSLLNRT